MPKPVSALLVLALALALRQSASAQDRASQAVQANAADLPTAPDSVARRTLVDLRPLLGRARFDLRYSTANNFTGAVLPGYGVAVPLLRREAAVALARVERALESRGYHLEIWDGYRPVRGTLGMVAWCEREHRIDLLNDGYIARHSRHNQGVAIDLTLVDDRSGKELDMGTGFDTFSAAAHTANAAGAVAAHRALLGDAMRRSGFVNYVDEWWHFSFDVRDPMPFDLPLENWR